MTEKRAFEQSVADALHSHGDALPVSEQTLTRLLTNAGEGRRVVVPLRRRMRTASLIVAAAAVVTVTAALPVALSTQSERHIPPAGTTSPAPPHGTAASRTARATPVRTPTPSRASTPVRAHPAHRSSSTRTRSSFASSSHDSSGRPAPETWNAPSLTITVAGLGAVERGMSLSAAEVAAGYTFDGAGDGFRYSLTRDRKFGNHLFVGPGPNNGGATHGPTECVGAQSASGSQVVVTTAGVRLGDTTDRLLRAYGSAAVHIPAPTSGMNPQNGYVVNQDGGTLAFAVDRTNRIIAIVAGPTGLTPSECTG